MTSVKVAVRVRPLNNREHDLDCKFIIQMDGRKTSIVNPKVPEHATEGDSGREGMRLKEFTFDFSFWSVEKFDSKYVSQQQVFQALGLDVVSSAFDGYNACVFAYGQTGSGKTYTMMGNPGDEGLIPRICKELFSHMTDETTSYRTEVSYLEIYNEKVRDLLKNTSHHKPIHNLRVREHPKQGPYVQDLSKFIVNNFEDIEELMHRGNAVRTTASTNMNDVSSRSHAIFTIVFTQAKFTEDMPCEMSSKIHLVDLAGSERADASGATGQRLKEGASINKSLVTLGTVISVLAEMSEKSRHGKVFIPYRDSVLTWLLKDSLGGNSRTIMVATISPADVNYGETLSTLRYANRAKNIINRPTVNEDPNVKLIRELREEIDRLKTMLGGSIDHISTPKVQEKLHENEARIKVLTEEWAGKWSEAANILKDQTLALRKEGLGVVLDSALPHLIGIDDDILSTGIMLYHLKEGRTTVGRTDAEEAPDIVIAGIEVEEEHCVIEHRLGEVILYPINDALCTVNGTVVSEPTKLTQGAVILLGRTNMFRFNHPAEAAKMKQELKNSGLSLSRTSLLSKSMSDLYRSSENLSLMGAGFELEYMHNKEKQELEEKRLQISLLEKRYYKAEEERDSQQTVMEKMLEDKEQQLLLLQQEIQVLKDEMTEKQSKLQSSVEQVLSLQEQLKQLEEIEKALHKKTKEAKEQLQQEIVKIKDDCASKKEKLEVELQSLDQENTDLNTTKKNLVNETIEEVNRLEKEINKNKEIVQKENETLQKLQKDFNESREKVLQDNAELQHKIEVIDIEQDNYIKECDLKSQNFKDKWNNVLGEISEENKKIEEAWKDLREYEEQHKVRAQTMDTSSDTNREKLQKEEQEIMSARTLLKNEEEKVAAKEKDVLDKIESEMDESEKTKEEKIKVFEDRKLCYLKDFDSQIGVISEELKNKQNLIFKCEKDISKDSNNISQLKKECEQKLDKANKSLADIETKKDSLQQLINDNENDLQHSILDLNEKITVVEKHHDEEMSKIQIERERLLEIISQSSVAVGCCTESDLDLVIADITSQEDTEIQKKIKDLEELQKIVDQAQLDLEEKQRKFDEQRDLQLDKIEYEKLKLQEMEHQERINTLVEQEVKRRMFEEKLARENRRKQEREKEKKERELEIQKLKEQHNRELRQLKAKYERKSTGSKSLNPSKANPYATVMSPDQDRENSDFPGRKSTGSSSHSGSSSIINPGDQLVIRLSIPSYRSQGHGSDTHIEYEVKIAIGDDQWTIYRRYSRFRRMHQDLKRIIPEVGALVFPPRKLFSRSERVVTDRRRQLELYLRHLIEIFLRTPGCPLHPARNKYPSKQVLCDFEPFFKLGLFETSKHGTT